MIFVFGAVRVAADHAVKVVVIVGHGVTIRGLALPTGSVAAKGQDGQARGDSGVDLLLVGSVMLLALHQQLILVLPLFLLGTVVFRYAIRHGFVEMEHGDFPLHSVTGFTFSRVSSRISIMKRAPVLKPSM